MISDDSDAMCWEKDSESGPVWCSGRGHSTLLEACTIGGGTAMAGL